MNNTLKNIIYTVFLGFGAILCAPYNIAHAASILQVSVKGNIETIQLSDLPGTTPPKVVTMSKPARLVIDVPLLPAKTKVSLKGYKGRFVKSVRMIEFDSDTSRIILALARPIKVTKAINVITGKTETLTVTISSGTAGKNAKDISTRVSSSKQEKTDKKPQAANPPAAAQPDGDTPEAAPAPTATDKTKKKVSAKPMIVIDPGHGGVDPGTHGSGNSYEKDIVLSYALALKEELLKSGRYRVMLTRDTDTFIHLRERVAIARKAGANLFVSIHADSDPGEEARGLSVYTVSEEASDKESAALAARENKADVIGGVDLSDKKDDVANILISLAQRDTKNESAIFADYLVRSLLDQKIDLLENSHRFAGFAVLKAPDVPSVLVEVGFLSNAEEEKLLKSKTHRTRVATALAKGIDKYLRKRKVDL